MVTGGTSMVGRAICELLAKRGDTVDNCPHDDIDFLDDEACDSRIQQFQPELIINLAGYNGNIRFNKTYPADIFIYNTQLCLNILSSARYFKVPKVVSLIPSCSYPNENLLKRENYYNGKPSDSVACHGLAKRNLVAFSEMINKQYELPYITICANTIYGPHDSYDETKTKVMGGLIKRTVEAHRQKMPNITNWGTGCVYRGFIYAKDVARLLLQCAADYTDSSLPLNLPCHEIMIRDLATMVKNVVGYEGKILWDGQEDGQYRKQLIFEPTLFQEYTLREGIEETVKWYMETYRD